MPPPRVDTVGSDCSHISVRGALPVYTFVEGIYALGEPENGRPTWRSADGQSVIAWSTAKQGDEYFGAGTGAVWGILNAHKHRYLVKGTEARSPPSREWIPRGVHGKAADKPSELSLRCLDVGDQCVRVRLAGAGSPVNGLFARDGKHSWKSAQGMAVGLRHDSAERANSWFGEQWPKSNGDAWGVIASGNHVYLAPGAQRALPTTGWRVRESKRAGGKEPIPTVSCACGAAQLEEGRGAARGCAAACAADDAGSDCAACLCHACGL